MVKAPHGTEMSCKGWLQEAALRMLMNNLDPEVAERPEDLIVYGGRGKLHEILIVIMQLLNPFKIWKMMKLCLCRVENQSVFLKHILTHLEF